MAWSIAEVARLSRVTSRTLRHYDEIGLLPPAWIGSNGHRHYEEADLLRLQQILLMRELGLGLREIAAVLDRQVDPVAALREHRRRLLAERDRLDTLVRTVSRTIAELETVDEKPNGERNKEVNGETREEVNEAVEGQVNREVNDGVSGEANDGMTGESDGGRRKVKINRPENLFEGFDASRYEAEARERWPREWERSRRSAGALSPEEQERIQRETTARMIRMAEFMAAGEAASAPAVQSEVDAHYQDVCRFWTPNAAAYQGLGQMYVDDPRFRSAYDRVAAGLAEYQRDAMAAYADSRLG